MICLLDQGKREKGKGKRVRKQIIMWNKIK